MANPHRGEAPLELGGKSYVVRIDFNAIADIQAETGIAPENLAEEFSHKSLPFLRAALAAGLSREGRRVSVRRAGDMIGEHLTETEAISTAIANALTRYFSGANLPKEAESDASPLPPSPPRPLATTPAGETAPEAVKTV